MNTTEINGFTRLKQFNQYDLDAVGKKEGVCPVCSH